MKTLIARLRSFVTAVRRRRGITWVLDASTGFIVGVTAGACRPDPAALRIQATAALRAER